MKVINEEDNFFNERKKQLKQKIMDDLLHSVFNNMNKNSLILDNAQDISDMIGSILVMFNREILTHFFITMGIGNKRKDFMKELFEKIRNQVDREIKNRLI
jgi:hypothetical protein